MRVSDDASPLMATRERATRFEKKRALPCRPIGFRASQCRSIGDCSLLFNTENHCFAAIHAALLTSTATMLARHLTATPQTVATSVSARRAAATAASAAATAAASAGTDLDRAAAYLAAVLAAARPPPAGLPAGP